MKPEEAKAIKSLRVRIYFFIHMDSTGRCSYHRARRDRYAVGKREWAYCDTNDPHLKHSVSTAAVDRGGHTGANGIDSLGLTYETVKPVQLIHSGFRPAFIRYSSFDLLTEWFEILRVRKEAV